MKNRKTIVISIITTIIILSIGLVIRGSETGILFDEIVMDNVHRGTTNFGTFVMRKISFLGSVYFILPLVILILIIMLKKKDLEAIRLLLLSTIGSLGLNLGLKEIFTRVRPLKYFLIE